MNITFLIGNGFDVNLGLKTQYKQFYPEYLNANKDLPDDNCVKKFCEIIKKDYENWGDFELAFAKNISGSVKDVGVILKNFDELFSEYLAEQCDQLIYDTQEVKLKFRDFILSPYKCLARADSNKINEFYIKNEKSDHNYTFINFNYTNTLKMLLKQLITPKRTDKVFVYSDNFSEFHIHGSLDEGYMIIGIDTLSQLANESMRENERLNR